MSHHGQGRRGIAAGALPTDADLERIVRGDLAGTAMPIFINLPDREIKSVIEYVKSFSSRWRNPKNCVPALRLPPQPAWFENEALLKSHAERGRHLFGTACVACHGPDGSGRGALRRVRSKTPGASR